jgi:hypothetical protein
VDTVFHLAAYDESVDGSVTINRLTPVADPVLRTIDTDFFLVPQGYSKLGAYYLVGPTVTRGILESPSFGNVQKEVIPVDVAAEPVSNPNIHARFDKPLNMTPQDKLAFVVSNGAADRSIGLVWLVDKAIKVSQDPSPHFVTRWTNGTTLVVNTWTNGALTFASVGLGLGVSQLPPGRYGIVGMRAQAAGLIAARLVPQVLGSNASPVRPGVIGFDSAGDIECQDGLFRAGRLGAGESWMEFDDLSVPTVDFLSISADTAQVVLLDLKYLGPRGTVTAVQPQIGVQQ